MLVIDRNTVVESVPLYFSGWTRQQKQNSVASYVEARQIKAISNSPWLCCAPRKLARYLE